MKFNSGSGGVFAKCFSKERIEKATMWVLAFGVLLAVSFTILKYAIRDYHEIRHELHQSEEIQAGRNSVDPRTMASMQCWAAVTGTVIVCSTRSGVPAAYQTLQAIPTPRAQGAGTRIASDSPGRESQ